jgi:hypothetical protein
LKAGSGVDANSINVYNGQKYAIYGRLSFAAVSVGDYFAAAPKCPAIKDLRDCTSADCGEYCLAGSSIVKLDFGEPGVNVQDGFIKLGRSNHYPSSGTFSSRFEYNGRTIPIKISGYNQVRNDCQTVINSYAGLSNLLRSCFLRWNTVGAMTLEISGLELSTKYRIKTYHHFSYDGYGGRFTFQYEGNGKSYLKQSNIGRNPDPPLMHTEIVKSSTKGIIRLVMRTYSTGQLMSINGMEIERSGVLPDGSSKLISNCVENFKDYDVFLRICGGTTPTPTMSPTIIPTTLSPTLTPTTLSPTLRPTAHWHHVFECTESDVKIESPTFASLKTENALHDAVIECQGACQANVDCKFWSLNRKLHLCELKKNNLKKVPSEDYISGERLCKNCGNKTEDLFCNSKGCEVSLSVTDICSENFSIQILHGDFDSHGEDNETVYMYINDDYIGECDPGFDLDRMAYGTPPGWHYCGSYSTPPHGNVTLRLKAGSGVNADSINVYNGRNYAIYGRLSFGAASAGDYFAPAPKCPATKDLRDCTSADCGEYCLAGARINLDFGQPGVDVQDGFIKLGLRDTYPSSGTFSSTFEYNGQTVAIKISGYNQVRNRLPTVVNSYAGLSNLLRSCFLRWNTVGAMTLEISGLELSTKYRIKTYHHFSYDGYGHRFTFQ